MREGEVVDLGAVTVTATPEEREAWQAALQVEVDAGRVFVVPAKAELGFLDQTSAGDAHPEETDADWCERLVRRVEAEMVRLVCGDVGANVEPPGTELAPPATGQG